jgi:DNA-binding NtrC family response regulator
VSILGTCGCMDILYSGLCRCRIPVIIMGETGCGKTRLIRYMCDLARQGLDYNNMLILKVCLN